MENILGKLKYMLNKGKGLTEIATELGISENEVIGMVIKLKEEGYMYDYINGAVQKVKPAIERGEITIGQKKDRVRFIALSDTHLGSKWDNLKLLEHAYETAENDGCDFVAHSGDMFEGDFKGKRPDHIYQVKALGLEQLDYVIQNYPKSEIPTYYITGNHDGTFLKTAGANIGKLLADRRTDLTYLGQDLGDIKIGKNTVRLRHGAGGGAYAKSYKLQKYCETLPIVDIPEFILQGHFHYSGYFRNRDINCFNVPAMQGYTPYAKGLGLPEEMGFWEITYYTDSRGQIISVVPELHQFKEKAPKLVRVDKRYQR